MSRVGKQPVVLPKGVKAVIAGQLLSIEGPKGKLQRQVRPEITVELADGTLSFSRQDDSKSSRAFHGMERALANSMVVGVSQGFAKELELVGVGYKAEMKGSNILFSLGYSHDIDFPVPQGVQGSVVRDGRDTFIKLESVDKQLVGQVAAQIKNLRPPEIYKGKGVRYRGQVIKTKAGKAGKK